MQITTRSPQETLMLGKKLGGKLIPGDIVLLFGELGSGKTLLTQGIALGLGIDSDKGARSPTFTLINEYSARLPIYHVDLYRLESPSEIEGIGLEEFLYGSGITLIEWAEKLRVPSSSSLLFNIHSRLEIQISISTSMKRHINFEPIHFKDRLKPLFPLL